MTEKIASLELLGEGLFLFRDKIYSKETQNVVITMWSKGKSYIDKFPTPSHGYYGYYVVSVSTMHLF